MELLQRLAIAEARADEARHKSDRAGAVARFALAVSLASLVACALVLLIR